MKQLKIGVHLGVLFICAAFILGGCSPGASKDMYCTFVTQSNRCDIAKGTKLCFKCDGKTCPDIRFKQVFIKQGENDSCKVTLGEKLDPCNNCPEDGQIVVLSSIAPEE